MKKTAVLALALALAMGSSTGVNARVMIDEDVLASMSPGMLKPRNTVSVTEKKTSSSATRKSSRKAAAQSVPQTSSTQSSQQTTKQPGFTTSTSNKTAAKSSLNSTSDPLEKMVKEALSKYPEEMVMEKTKDRIVFHPKGKPFPLYEFSSGIDSFPAQTIKNPNERIKQLLLTITRKTYEDLAKSQGRNLISCDFYEGQPELAMVGILEGSINGMNLKTWEARKFVPQGPNSIQYILAYTAESSEYDQWLPAAKSMFIFYGAN